MQRRGRIRGLPEFEVMRMLSSRSPRRSMGTSDPEMEARNARIRSSVESKVAGRRALGTTSRSTPGGAGYRPGGDIRSIHPAVGFGLDMTRGVGDALKKSITSDVHGRLARKGIYRDSSGTWQISGMERSDIGRAIRNAAIGARDPSGAWGRLVRGTETSNQPYTPSVSRLTETTRTPATVSQPRSTPVPGSVVPTRPTIQMPRAGDGVFLQPRQPQVVPVPQQPSPPPQQVPVPQQPGPAPQQVPVPQQPGPVQPPPQANPPVQTLPVIEGPRPIPPGSPQQPAPQTVPIPPGGVPPVAIRGKMPPPPQNVQPSAPGGVQAPGQPSQGFPSQGMEHAMQFTSNYGTGQVDDIYYPYGVSGQQVGMTTSPQGYDPTTAPSVGQSTQYVPIRPSGISPSTAGNTATPMTREQFNAAAQQAIGPAPTTIPMKGLFGGGEPTQMMGYMSPERAAQIQAQGGFTPQPGQIPHEGQRVGSETNSAGPGGYPGQIAAANQALQPQPSQFPPQGQGVGRTTTPTGSQVDPTKYPVTQPGQPVPPGTVQPPGQSRPGRPAIPGGVRTPEPGMTRQAPPPGLGNAGPTPLPQYANGRSWGPISSSELGQTIENIVMNGFAQQRAQQPPGSPSGSFTHPGSAVSQAVQTGNLPMRGNSVSGPGGPPQGPATTSMAPQPGHVNPGATVTGSYGAGWPGDQMDTLNAAYDAASSQLGVPGNVIKAVQTLETGGDVYGKTGTENCEIRPEAGCIALNSGIYSSTAAAHGLDYARIRDDPQYAAYAVGKVLSDIAYSPATSWGGEGSGTVVDTYGWDGVVNVYFGGNVYGGFQDELGTGSGEYLGHYQNYLAQLGGAGPPKASGSDGVYAHPQAQVFQGQIGPAPRYGPPVTSTTGDMSVAPIPPQMQQGPAVGSLAPGAPPGTPPVSSPPAPGNSPPPVIIGATGEALALPPGVTPGSGQAIVELAMTGLGVPYGWGNIPNPGDPISSWDCSGFTRWVAHSLGYTNVPMGSEGQMQVAMDQGILKMDFSQIQPGDLVFYDTGWRQGGLCGANVGLPSGQCINNASHVGIYIGNGQVIQAGTEGTTIEDLSFGGYPLLGYASPQDYAPQNVYL